MSLREYVRKRDFRRTAEPRGKKRKTRGAAPRFVVQKHDASRLHYDFRLEMDGTLKSWAVPKGFSFTRGDKRLAMQVEDHPIEYADFEGIIPKGQYGGGTVMVWDFGTYQNLGSNAVKDLAAGKLHFALNGRKLKGEWTLVRMSRGEGNEWLYELKFDGYRALALKSGRAVRLLSRNEKDFTAKFPEIAEAVLALPVREAFLDGCSRRCGGADSRV